MPRWLSTLILISPWATLIPMGMSMSAPVSATATPTPCAVPADGFDSPVGPPDGDGYYDAQPFGQNHHLGEDWNGRGGGNSDYGDPVSSVARGVVRWVGAGGPGWGTVLLVRHCTLLPDGTVEEVESLYAHLSAVAVAAGDVVERGQLVGRIGDADGAYIAHLHLEIRDVGRPIGSGYGRDRAGYYDPSVFIGARRPADNK